MSDKVTLWNTITKDNLKFTPITSNGDIFNTTLLVNDKALLLETPSLIMKPTKYKITQYKNDTTIPTAFKYIFDDTEPSSVTLRECIGLIDIKGKSVLNVDPELAKQSTVFEYMPLIRDGVMYDGEDDIEQESTNWKFITNKENNITTKIFINKSNTITELSQDQKTKVTIFKLLGNSSVKCILAINYVWINKKKRPQHNKRTYGISVKILQMEITPKPLALRNTGLGGYAFHKTEEIIV